MRQGCHILTFTTQVGHIIVDNSYAGHNYSQVYDEVDITTQLP